MRNDQGEGLGRASGPARGAGTLGGAMMVGKTKSELVAEIIVLATRVEELEARLAGRRGGKSSSPGSAAGGRSRVEEALVASEVRYRRLFETAKDGILILDAATGTISDSNPFLEQLLGYDHDELLGRKLWEIGPFKDIAASQESFRHLQTHEYIRYEDLPLETKSGQRRQVEFISNLYMVDAAKVIQCNIRDITARMHAETSIREANERLTTLVAVLRRRDTQMTLLSRMSDLLQTCETPEEAYRVIAMTAPELFIGQCGCLAMFHVSSKVLEVVARWGDETLVEDTFPMEACWALRRGRLHEVTDPATSLLCDHFTRLPAGGYRCLPLTVQGETVGVLHLEIGSRTDDDQESGERQLTLTVGEAIKLSLANLRLRLKLQEQATRDPLTGLFNRRYLEDTLPRELHRALRRGVPLCVAMVDLDHFKQFNDTFGHDAGDLVLREASRMLRENLRKSDVACRYGGEEFLLVLPDSSLDDTIQRLEQIRLRFEGMELRYKGQLVATMTFSAGVAVAPEHGSAPEELLQAADDALYAAKLAGRNHVLAYRPRV